MLKKPLFSRLPHLSRKVIIILAGSSIVIISFPFILFFSLTAPFSSQTFTDSSQVKPAYAALVLGAGIRADGTPSDILRDRITVGIQLYKSGKVKKLIMSGDNRMSHHNEPEVMRRLAIEQGIPESDVQPDYGGRRTYDSCWRAKNIFSQDQIIVVTQSFHMPRALFLCNQLGITSQGVTSDTDHYSSREWNYWKLRDMLSFSKSLLDLYILSPDLVKGEKIAL